MASNQDDFVPIPLPAKVKVAIHQTVHNLVLQYGFQTYNRNPKNKEDAGRQDYTRATEALVCQRLEEELEQKYLRTHEAGAARFEASVLRLHAGMFEPYRKWEIHVKLNFPFTNHGKRQREMTSAGVQLYLNELALYYLIYSEGANLRHLPELIWFVFWICRHSKRFEEVLTLPANHPCSPQFMLDADKHQMPIWNFGGSLPDIRHYIRNTYQLTIATIRKTMESDSVMRQQLQLLGVVELGTTGYQLSLVETHKYTRQREAYIKHVIKEAGPITMEDTATLLRFIEQDGSGVLINMIWEMVLVGDGGRYLEKVVQPVFVYLSEQVMLMGHAKEEASLRVGYDDCNESLVIPENVHAALRVLQVLPAGSMHTTRVQAVIKDPWEALITIGDKDGTNERRDPSAYRNYPRDPKFLGCERQILSQLQRQKPVEESKWKEAYIAAHWWRTHIFQKTFVERRSFLMIFRAFFRVYAFHLITFHILAAFAWADTWPSRWYYACSCVITHSALHVADSASSIFLCSPLGVVREEERQVGEGEDTKSKTRTWRVHQKLFGSWRTRIGQFIGLCGWIILTIILVVFFAAGLNFKFLPKAVSNFAKSLKLDSGKGWVISTAVYAAVWVVYELVRNVHLGFVGRHVYEYFGLSPAETYFRRSNMSTPFARCWGNILMWVAIIAVKVFFDYFAVLRPLRKPLAKLDEASWALFTARGWTMDILLMIAQVVPNFLVTMFDTGIFYQLAAAVVGSAYGLFHLRLGQVRNWKQVIAAYPAAPEHWVRKCMSKDGFNQVFRVLKANDANSKRMAHMRGYQFHNPYTDDEDIQALAQWLCFLSTWNEIVKSLRKSDLISNKEMRNLLFEEVKYIADKGMDKSSHPPSRDDVKVQTSGAPLRDPSQELSAATPTPSETLGRMGSNFPKPRAPEDDYLKVKPPPPYLLPRFVSAGQIQSTVKLSIHDCTKSLVMEQAFDRLLWLLSKLRIIDDARDRQVERLQMFRPSKRAASDTQQNNREELMKEVVNLVKHLADQKLITNLKSQMDDMKANSGAKARLLDLYRRAIMDDEQAKRQYVGLWGAEVVPGKDLPIHPDIEKWVKAMDSELSFFSKAMLKIAQTLLDEVHATEHQVNSRFLSHLYGIVGSKTAVQKCLRDVKRVLITIEQDARQGLVGTQQQRRRCDLYRYLHVGFEDILADQAVRDMFRQLASWLVDILSLSEMDTEPVNDEAKRIIQFFMTSLYNPDMKTPTSLGDMKSLTTLTPHYEEDVVYALDANDLEAILGTSISAGERKALPVLLDEDGDLTSSMKYLKTVNKTEWVNLQERVLDLAKSQKLPNIPVKASDVREFHFKPNQPLHSLRLHFLLWASLRSQHLARTARGMMLYEEALDVLAKTEYTLDDMGGPGGEQAAMEKAMKVLNVMDNKYNYIITSQVFGACLSGKKGAKGRWVAKGVEALLNLYPRLTVAYIDSQPHWKVELPEYTKMVNEQSSVLVKAVLGGTAAASQQDVTLESMAPAEELYRVRLPLNYEHAGLGVILGEGKPENQNHAIIFCFGELIQTIDMNQDNNLAEAFKIRNLCTEFGEPDKIKKPRGARKEPKPKIVQSDLELIQLGADIKQTVVYTETEDTALVGFREWIFSSDSGALADFAATTEFTFGTIVQRVMTYPGAVRFHYGHPDVWNRQFVITRGGVSKSNKTLHVSEDVFGGYNIILRGGSIKYVEYISVGKGRDMGFSSILGFEAKIAQGNGEQVMSREVFRLGTGFDFFRLMSWYHTGNGFFINSALTMFSVYVTSWVLLFISLALEDGRLETAVFAASAAYSNIQILQLGSFSIIVFLFAMWLERGPVEAMFIILKQFFSGSLLFYVFRAQTTNVYFTGDVNYGGAGYVATGRGYTLTSVPFVTLFQNYARTHMSFGADIALLLLLVLIVGAPIPTFSMWSAWLVVIACVFAPFWFNPFVFDTERTKKDFNQWREWMDNRIPVNNKSWIDWNRQELAKARNDGGKQTDRLLTVIKAICSSLLTLLLSVTAIDSLQSRTLNTWILFGIVTLVALILAGIWVFAHNRYMHNGLGAFWRIVMACVSLLMVGLVIIFGVLFIPGHGYRFINIFIILYANYQLLKLVVTVLTFAFPRVNIARVWTDQLMKLGDSALGVSIFAMLFALSLVNNVFNLGKLQGVLLFNSAYARQYVNEVEMQDTNVERWHKEFQEYKKKQERLEAEKSKVA